MKSGVITLAERISVRYRGSEFDPYLQSLLLDCHIRNLTQKTIDGYIERLACLFDYLAESGIAFDCLSKRIVKEYILSLMGNVSDETINGRIRV